jgi:hypothetical protein
MVSKADLMHFSLELCKKLDIRYRSPRLPVDLSMASQAGVLSIPTSEIGGNMYPGRVADVSSVGALNGDNYRPDLSSVHAMFAPRSPQR